MVDLKYWSVAVNLYLFNRKDYIRVSNLSILFAKSFLASWELIYLIGHFSVNISLSNCCITNIIYSKTLSLEWLVNNYLPQYIMLDWEINGIVRDKWHMSNLMKHLMQLFWYCSNLLYARHCRPPTIALLNILTTRLDRSEKALFLCPVFFLFLK